MTKGWFSTIQPLQTAQWVRTQWAGLGSLLLNHVDAWCVTGFTGAVALLVHGTLTPASLWLLFALMAGYWQAFLLNDYFDAPFDRSDPQKARHNFFVHHPQRLGTLLALLALPNLLVAWGFLQYGWRGLVVMGICLVMMWAYSAPPLRLKSRPGLDLLVHGLFVETFPYWTCLYLTGVSWRALDMVVLTLFFLTSLTAQLEQQVRDFDLDRRYERTFTTVVGRARAFLLLKITTALLLIIGFTALGLGIIPWRFAPFAVIGLPVFLHRFLRPPTIGRPRWLTWLALGAGGSYLVFLLVQHSR